MFSAVGFVGNATYLRAYGYNIHQLIIDFFRGFYPFHFGQSTLVLPTASWVSVYDHHTMLLSVSHLAFRRAECCLMTFNLFSRQNQPTLVRHLSSLTVLEQREGKLQNASLSAITAAQKLGGSITGFIAGSKARSAAEEAAKVEGLKRVIMIENDAYDKVR